MIAAVRLVGPVLLAALPELAAAEGLTGRTVVFNAMTWDDPAQPYVTSQDYIATVGPGPEFGMRPEAFGDLVVVPVLIDLDATRLTFSYENLPGGLFAEAGFNGYVMTFLGECALITGASVDPATTLPLAPDALTVDPLQLRINVSGLAYGPEDRIVIKVTAADCPLS